MAGTTFTAPDLTTFLGLVAVGQRLEEDVAVVECRLVVSVEDPFCGACGAQGVGAGTVVRRLAHLPVGWRPTELVVRVRRLACGSFRRVWRQDAGRLATKRSKLTWSAVAWGCRP